MGVFKCFSLTPFKYISFFISSLWICLSNPLLVTFLESDNLPLLAFPNTTNLDFNSSFLSLFSSSKNLLLLCMQITCMCRTVCLCVCVCVVQLFSEKVPHTTGSFCFFLCTCISRFSKSIFLKTKKKLTIFRLMISLFYLHKAMNCLGNQL